MSFCVDGAGLRLDPRSGQRSPLARLCSADPEPVSTCESIGDAFEIRRPGLGPSDIVDLPTGPSVEVPGHVTDCATMNGDFLLASEEKIVLVAGGRTRTIAKSGADRVALGDRWIAWSDGKAVHAAARR